MPADPSVGASLDYLHKLAVQYGRFESDPAAFLSYLAEQPRDRLQAFRDYAAEGVTTKRKGLRVIRPVAFCRLVISDRLLRDDEVTLGDLEDLQQAVQEGSVDAFGDYKDLLEAISNLPKVSGNPFLVWTPFRILFYIDYYHERDAVKEHLDRVYEAVRESLDLTTYDHHLAGFDYNNNFGTDHCWLALYPSDYASHKDTHQLFLGIFPDGVDYGLVRGSNLGKWLEEKEYRRKGTLQTTSIDEIVDYLDEVHPELVRQNLDIGPDPVPRAREPHRLNTVLYGPPGTGKTYSVQLRAVEIIDGSEDPSTAPGRFRELVKEGRVELVTFHPSYSYEEFVEGFRYSESERIPTLHDGVFKRLVNRAISPARRTPSDGATIWKISLGDASEEHIYHRCISSSEIAIGWYNDVDFSGMGEEEIRELFASRGAGGETNNIRSVNYFVNEIQDGDLVAVRESNRTIRAIGVVEGSYQHRESYDEYRHVRPVTWLDRRSHDIYEMNSSVNLTMPTLYRLKHVSLQEFVELLPVRPDDRPYVLVIDEINRGNLPRIFGELITLLESDKRRGADHEMSVRLPYSQQTFTVPPNLYILGTMNTADRSIALMDVALRRRFQFEELMPDVEIVRDALMAGLDADEGDFELSADQIDIICGTFMTLNRRITVLLDRDHQIGHSVLMKVRSMRDVHRAFYENVVALLQEYFYNSRQRLTEVLGEYAPGENRGFVRSLGEDYRDAVSHLTVTEDNLPWEIHRYPVGDFDDVLRRTF